MNPIDLIKTFREYFSLFDNFTNDDFNNFNGIPNFDISIDNIKSVLMQKINAKNYYDVLKIADIYQYKNIEKLLTIFSLELLSGNYYFLNKMEHNKVLFILHLYHDFKHMYFSDIITQIQENILNNKSKAVSYDFFDKYIYDSDCMNKLNRTCNINNVCSVGCYLYYTKDIIRTKKYLDNPVLINNIINIFKTNNYYLFNYIINEISKYELNGFNRLTLKNIHLVNDVNFFILIINTLPKYFPFENEYELFNKIINKSYSFILAYIKNDYNNVIYLINDTIINNIITSNDLDKINFLINIFNKGKKNAFNKKMFIKIISCSWTHSLLSSVEKYKLKYPCCQFEISILNLINDLKKNNLANKLNISVWQKYILGYNYTIINNHLLC